MQLSEFLNTQRKLRNIPWIIIFFTVLVPPALPVALLLERYKFAITMLHQSINIMARSIMGQLSRKESLWLGPFKFNP